jgi:hypothetical protein
MQTPAVEVKRVSATMTDDWVETAIKKRLNDGHYDPKLLVSGQAVNVLKPDRSLLLASRPGLAPATIIAAVYPALLKFVRTTGKRSVAAGGAKELYSATLGWLNGEVTFATKQHPQEWQIVQLLIRFLNRAMRDLCPDQYRVLQEAALRTPDNLLIPFTVFTTVTVNYWTPEHNAWMAVHSDKGNLKGGATVP